MRWCLFSRSADMQITSSVAAGILEKLALFFQPVAGSVRLPAPRWTTAQVAEHLADLCLCGCLARHRNPFAAVGMDHCCLLLHRARPPSTTESTCLDLLNLGHQALWPDALLCRVPSRAWLSTPCCCIRCRQRIPPHDSQHGYAEVSVSAADLLCGADWFCRWIPRGSDISHRDYSTTAVCVRHVHHTLRSGLFNVLHPGLGKQCSSAKDYYIEDSAVHHSLSLPNSSRFS